MLKEQEENAINDQTATEPKPKAGGTYVIQIPKDQIYRVPPPQNAHLFETYSRRGSRKRGSCCCRCFLWSISLLLLLLLSLAIAAGVLYFVFTPKLPSYSIEKLNIKDFSNVTALSPEFDVTVRAENPNKKISIYYEEGSDVSGSYSNVVLSRGSWPVFHQERRNVTVFTAVLKGSGVKLSRSMKSELMEQQRKGAVPLKIDVKVPVKVKFGGVKTWKIDVKVSCDLEVDKFAENSKIVSKKCKTKVDIW